MIDYTEDNIFLNGITELYEAIHYPEDKDIINIHTWIRKDGQIFPRLTSVKVNLKSEKIYKDNLNIIDEFLKDDLHFEDVFKFATFIRSIDKILFYRNNSRSVKVSCTTSLDNNNSRELIINTESAVTIKINLTKSDTIYVDSCNEVIIDITRDYGKKIISKFIINNGNIVINNSDDKMLLYVVTNTIQNIMANYFRMYLDAIYNDNLFDYNTYKYFEPK